MLNKVAIWSALVIGCCWLTLVVIAFVLAGPAVVEEHEVGGLHLTGVHYSAPGGTWILPAFAVAWAGGIARTWQRRRLADKR